MSRPPQQLWKAIVTAKERAKERLQRELADAKRRHAARMREVEDADALVDEARSKQLAHEDRIAELLASPEGLLPTSYLAHDLYREPLARALDEARAHAGRAREACQQEARAVEQAGMAVRRADAALDAAREAWKKACAAVRRRADERTDEEAGESAAARMRRGG